MSEAINHRLVSAINVFYPTVAAMCRENGLDPSKVGQLINKKASPKLASGEWSTDVIKLADALAFEPVEVFDEHANCGVDVVSIMDVQEQDLTFDGAAALDEGVFATAMTKKIQEECTNMLGPRGQFVINMRFGLAGLDEARTLDAVGYYLGVGCERVRQIELAALRQLRSPPVKSRLKPFWEHV